MRKQNKQTNKQTSKQTKKANKHVPATWPVGLCFHAVKSDNNKVNFPVPCAPFITIFSMF